MFPTRTERAVAVATEAEAGAVLFAGAAAVAELAVTGLVLATFLAVLVGTVGEALAVVGVLVWATGLLVLVAFDTSRFVQRLLDRRARRRETDLRPGARR